MVSQCRKILWASLQCFRKFGVSKHFMHNRGYHVFSAKIFCLTVPKNFVKEPFSVSLNSGIKKFYAYEGNITIFYRNLLSHSTEKLRRGTLLCFTKFLVSKKFMNKRGGGGVGERRGRREGTSRFSIENILSHSAEKFHRGTFLCCVLENFR